MALPILDNKNRILNPRDVYVVNCCSSPNVDDIEIVFKAMCPQELVIVAVEQNYGNRDRPCRWLVKYQLRNGATTFENAKASFNEILRFIPFNTQCTDRHISGPPIPTYNVLYSVTSCRCNKLDFEL